MSQLSFGDRDGFIWLDGQMVDWRSAKIHSLSHALHYAGCVFEGDRAYNGRIFKLQQHSERLIKSANILGMDCPYSAEQISRACDEVIAKNGFKDAYVRPFVWRGDDEMGLGATKCKIHVAVAAWEWPPYFDAAKMKQGLRFMISPWRRPAPNTAPWEAKAAGLYMICTLSKHEAIKSGYDDVMMLDFRGQIAESSAANIFFVINGELHTPIADCFLNGITRQTTIEIARKKGYKVVERALFPYDMRRATECFITGTAVEIMPVGEIEEYKFTPGKVTFDLINAYHQEAGSGFRI